MKPRARCRSLASLALIALFTAQSVFPSPTVTRSQPSPQARQADLLLYSHQPTLSDFDGDHHLDTAELFSNGSFKRIQIHLSSRRLDLHFDSKTIARGLLFAKDVDRDNEPDLVWVLPNQPRSAVVWLGDGRGNFEIAKDPGSYDTTLPISLAQTNVPEISPGQAYKQPVLISPSVIFDRGVNKQLILSRPASSLTGIARPIARRLADALTYIHRRPPPLGFVANQDLARS